MARAKLISLDRFVLPRGRKKGLKLEPTRGPRAAYFRDLCDPFPKRKLVPREDWKRFAESRFHKSQRSWYPYTSDQNGRGSCASETKDNTFAALAHRQGLPLVVFNPLGTYHFVSGGRDGGSSIGENLKFGMTNGCYPEEVWPRYKDFRAKPSTEASRIAKFFLIREFFRVTSTPEFVSALLQGYLVAAGYTGHSISFCQFIYPSTLVYKNSWGNWGDNGFGKLSANKVYYPYGAYAYEDVEPYVREKKSGGWEWLCGWQPKYDQADLARRVADYNYDLMSRPRGMKESSRQAMYEEYVDGCKLAT